MKIALITTVRHNVGDDFVREGIKYLLKKNIKGKISFTEIHKHSPVSTRYGFEKDSYLNKYFSYLEDKLPIWCTRDRIMEADIVVQCGAPVYWFHGKQSNCVDHNEWYGPLIRRRFYKKKGGVLLNIAAGSCQRYHSDGSEFSKEEASPVISFMREFYNKSAITTVRDSLLNKILKIAGLEVEVIPCTSIFAADEHNIQSLDPEYVVLSYMQGGAHYTFGQSIDFLKWEKTFRELYFELARRDNVVIACHSKNELDEIKRIIPDAKVFFSNNFIDYLSFYSKAKLGIMNRVHGAFIIASFGRPAIIIGNDSRAAMASEIGLRSFFVNDVDLEMLLSMYDQLMNEVVSYSHRMAQIKEDTLKQYSTLFSRL